MALCRPEIAISTASAGPVSFWSPAVTPVQVGRCQAYAAGEVPPRQLGGVQAVTQHTTQPFGWDLARQTERAADVVMMDGDVEQREPASEGRGQPLRPQPSLQPVEELFGAERCEFVDPHLIGVNDPTAE